jgi:hypothetical protein
METPADGEIQQQIASRRVLFEFYRKISGKIGFQKHCPAGIYRPGVF